MKNLERGSSTNMVGQNARITQVSDTIPTPLTESQAKRAALYLQMTQISTAPEVKVDKARTPRQLRREARERQEAAKAERNKQRREARAKSRAPFKFTTPARVAARVDTLTAALAVPAPTQKPELEAWEFSEHELDTYDAYEQERRAAPAPKPITRVQAQPVPELAELLDIEQFRPRRGRGYGTAGAGALAELLHELARRYLSTRPYLYSPDGRPPRQVVMHLPAELLAAVLAVSDNTVREWAAQLERAGYLYSRAHFTTSTNREGQRVTMADGTLYAVRLAPGQTARLRYSDYKRAYRDLDADRKAGRTAYNAIRWAEQRAEMDAGKNADQHAEKNTSVSFITQKDSAARAEIRRQLIRWAVNPGDISTQNPLNPDSEVFRPEELAEGLNTVQDVAYLVPTLAAAHHTKRAALVGILAATLSHILNDQQSRRYWCKIIWQAWQEELEGRGGLQALKSKLERLAVDIDEWKQLRNPAAVFAARV